MATIETRNGITVEHYDDWLFYQSDGADKARLPHLAYDCLLHHTTMERDKEYKAALTLDVSDQAMDVPLRPDYSSGKLFEHNFAETTPTKNVFIGWIVRTKMDYYEEGQTSLTFYLEHPGTGIRRMHGITFGYGMFWHNMPSDMLLDSVPLNTPMKCRLTIELVDYAATN